MLWPADKVERRSIESLTPYAQNARTHTPAQVSQIAASIEEWGWTNPILIDPSGEIIAGHARVLAAGELGLTEVPVMVATGWTEAQRKAYVIADNQLALGAGWDEAILKDELGALSELGFDLDRLGFDADALERFLAEPAAPAGFDEFGEDVPVEHECPRCHYRWSGNSAPGAGGTDAEDAAA